MGGFSLVPLLFALVDIPSSWPLKSPLLLIRSAPVYIFFMPTFVAFFSAYATNRLADVSWGQRAAQEDSAKPQRDQIERLAKSIAITMPLLNVAYAVAMA